MKRTNITASKRASNLICNSQARDYPTTQCHPHNLSHPQCHTPWNCHDRPPLLLQDSAINRNPKSIHLSTPNPFIKKEKTQILSSSTKIEQIRRIKLSLEFQ
ncbi:hypothetical protein HAX54_017731 [Datura stramonium]|uniref:Uncharacterized protein n=1 Tax=Datura stramonium TaxID=4076 RepID=A0ABS8S0P0_DATST|nr:hypothetical protein [Datura stramonium]